MSDRSPHSGLLRLVDWFQTTRRDEPRLVGACDAPCRAGLCGKGFDGGLAPLHCGVDGVFVEVPFEDGALSDAGHLASVLRERALVVEVERPVIGGFFGLEAVVLVRPERCAEGDEAVLVGVFGLIDQPVEMVWLARSGVEEHNGSAHGAWYVG